MAKQIDRRDLVASSLMGTLFGTLWVNGLLYGCKSTNAQSQLRDAGDQPDPSADDAESGLRVRKSVHKLTVDSPDVKAYIAGVKAMKALPASKFNNWLTQANIHKNSCPHSNWFFLPWHRMYLNWFEQICRQASGISSFNLPYWDWTADTSLPDFFYTDPTLNDPTRDQKQGETFAQLLMRTNNGVTQQQAQSFVDNIFAQTAIDRMLASKRFLEFGSGRASTQRGQSDTGSLEGGPHNNAHGLVGGNMGQVPLSPRDPIFWLHHCNIDRLWAVWVAKVGAGNALPPNPGSGEDDPQQTTDFWKNFVLTGFFDLSGNAVRQKVSEVLDHKAMGYTYDALPASTALLDDATAAPPAPSVVNNMTGSYAGGANGDSGEAAGPSSPSPDAAQTSNHDFTFNVAVDPNLAPVLAAIQGGQGGYYPLARLQIGNLPLPGDLSTPVSLTFYAAAGGQEVLVGAFAFFVHTDDEDHAHNNASLSFDLTQPLTDLGVAGVDASALTQITIGVDVVGMAAYQGVPAPFQGATAAITCFQ